MGVFHLDHIFQFSTILFTDILGGDEELLQGVVVIVVDAFRLQISEYFLVGLPALG